MYFDPISLAYAFPTIPSSFILDEEVVDAAPLNQGPPSTGARAGRKRGVKPPTITKSDNQEAKDRRAPTQEAETCCLGVILFPLYYFQNPSSSDY
jgi:hypothetical protein